MTRLIYLDQNKWIALAQAIHRNSDPGLLAVVAMMRQLKQSGAARFPLSLAHYIETGKAADPKRHEHVGSLMWELADQDTMASPAVIARAEVERGLAALLNLRFECRPLTLIGKGVAHAVGVPEAVVRIDDKDDVLSPQLKAFAERIGNRELNQSVLTGKSWWRHFERPRPDLSGPSKAFVEALNQLRENLKGADRDLQRQAVYARTLCDRLDYINATLREHAIPSKALEWRGEEGLTEFVDSMPLARVEVHLSLQWIRNPQLQAKPNDFNDWFFVGAAAAYCDVVVTERHLANLLNRGNLRKRATVTPDLRDLARV